MATRFTEKLRLALKELEGVQNLSDFIGAIAQISLLAGEYPELEERITGLYSKDTLISALWDLIDKYETMDMVSKLSAEELREILADAYN